jgi:hypothetical protein
MRYSLPLSAHTIVRALAHLDGAAEMDFVLVEAWLFSRPSAATTIVGETVALPSAH